MNSDNEKIIRFCYIGKKRERVDILMSALFSDISRAKLQKLILKRDLLVNNHHVEKSSKIDYKDEIFLRLKTDSYYIKPENLNIEIIYEDENILVINKDSGINSHPTPGEAGKSGSLVNAILYHCKGNLPSIGGEERPGIVHRLDKDTSGAIMIAKNDQMMNYLAKEIADRKVDKYYIAIVNGIIKDKYFEIESDIGRHPTEKIKMTTKNPINPKYAKTLGEVLGYIGEKYSILKIKLETGRTHQIRVHLSSIGFPIIGDKVYGNKRINEEVLKEFGLERQALHARKLGINLYDKVFEFEAEFKIDMKIILEKMEKI